MTLPPLPLPGLCMDVGTGFRKWYSADQMQAYATAAVLAEREACAKLCDSKSTEGITALEPTGSDIRQIVCGTVCAAAIRERSAV